MADTPRASELAMTAAEPMKTDDALRALQMVRTAILTEPEYRKVAAALGLAEIPFTARVVTNVETVGGWSGTNRTRPEVGISVPRRDRRVVDDILVRVLNTHATRSRS